MNVIAEIQRINEAELQKGIAGTPASWHAKYAAAAWVFVGNLPHALTEGDVICILSQFGEIEDINLVREEDTGKSKGFAFVKYEDARSCVLAVDNLTGSKVLGRSIRVDHVENYRLPKHLLEKEEQGASGVALTGPGHAYTDKELASGFSLQQGHDLFAPASEPAKIGTNEDNRMSKEERREAKQKRKEARVDRRREKEERLLEKEEEKRRKRARKYQDGSDHDDGSRRQKKHKKRRKHVRSRSPSSR